MCLVDDSGWLLDSRSTLRAVSCGGVPDVTAILACHNISASFPDGRTDQSAVLLALIVQPVKWSEISDIVITVLCLRSRLVNLPSEFSSVRVLLPVYQSSTVICPPDAWIRILDWSTLLPDQILASTHIVEAS
jgi:hypothetical protein